MKKLKTRSLAVLMAAAILTFGVGDVVTTALFLNSDSIEESDQTTALLPLIAPANSPIVLLPLDNTQDKSVIKESNPFAAWILGNFGFLGLVTLKTVCFIFFALFICKCQKFPLTAIAAATTIIAFGIIAIVHNLCLLNETVILPAHNLFLYAILFSVPPLIIMVTESAKKNKTKIQNSVEI